MADWGKIKTSAKLIEGYSKDVDNPFKLFTLLREVEYTKASWENVNKAFNGNEVVETQLDYINKCGKSLEEEFLFSMDMWVYSILDEDKGSIHERIAKSVNENEKLGYKLVFTFAEYKELLPVMWQTYKMLLKEKGITPKEEIYQMMWNDVFEVESIIRDSLYSPEVAYA